MESLLLAKHCCGKHCPSLPSTFLRNAMSERKQDEQKDDSQNISSEKKDWHAPDFTRLNASETEGGPGIDDEGGDSKLGS